MNLAAIASLIAGGWALINGLLHDIFVLKSDHGKKYDRELLRLLMDGHVLLTCGAMQAIGYLGLIHKARWAYATVGIATVSLLVYCAMIWPFLKSVVTALINVILLLVLAASFIA